MKLLDILKPDCIMAPLAASNKQQAIYELVDLLGAKGRVQQVDALKEAVWTREMTRSTGIGLGLAIPHGKCAGVENPAIAILRGVASTAGTAGFVESISARNTWMSSPDAEGDAGCHCTPMANQLGSLCSTASMTPSSAMPVAAKPLATR